MIKNERYLKQVIVMRNDLSMPHGSHNPAGTFVGIAIGPHWPESFIGITDHLKVR